MKNEIDPMEAIYLRTTMIHEMIQRRNAIRARADEAERKFMSRKLLLAKRSEPYLKIHFAQFGKPPQKPATCIQIHRVVTRQTGQKNIIGGTFFKGFPKQFPKSRAHPTCFQCGIKIKSPHVGNFPGFLLPSLFRKRGDVGVNCHLSFDLPFVPFVTALFINVSLY